MKAPKVAKMAKVVDSESSKVKKKWLMGLALGVFLTTSLAAIIGNTLLGKGFHLEYSISRYVGSATWSAVLFALGNVVVAISMLYFFYQLAETWKLPRVFNWLVVIMAIALLGLSVCPVGYFDLPGTAYASSTISQIHEVCSRTMFVMMLLATLLMVVARTASRATKVEGVLYIIYGAICVWAYFAKLRWFFAGLLIFESLYLVMFMVFCLACRSRRRLSLKGVKNG